MSQNGQTGQNEPSGPSFGDCGPDKAASAASVAAPGVDAPADALAAGSESKTNITCSRGLVDWLLMNRISLAFSSYQTGQLFLVGVLPNGSLSVHQRNFTRAMGLWCETDRIYVATVDQIWRLENVLQRSERANQNFDRLYVPRNAQVTGDLDVHELAVDRNGRVVFVNTKFSCLATFSLNHGFKALWKPAFISKLAAEDRCHLNGLAMVAGRPKYVTAASRADLLDGWRQRRASGGVVVEIENDRIVTDELSMPHSPREADGVLWVLDSGRGHLLRVDAASGKQETLAFCPGFLRGLSIWNGHAVVTISLPRDGTFEGLELDANIRARDGTPWCGVCVIELRSGDIVHWIRLDGFIRELFDVGVLRDVQCPMAIEKGSAELQHTITFETSLGGL
jgi:uncharacterized protein (TIGR03032 family)